MSRYCWICNRRYRYAYSQLILTCSSTSLKWKSDAIKSVTIQHIDLPLAYWSSSQVGLFTWSYPLAFLCHLSSSATLTFTVIISLSHERGLLRLRHESLQSSALRFGTNSFLLRQWCPTRLISWGPPVLTGLREQKEALGSPVNKMDRVEGRSWFQSKWLKRLMSEP